MGLQRRLELHLYRRLSHVLRWVIGVYLVVRFADLFYRDAFGAMNESAARQVMFIIENALFILPLIILGHRRWSGNERLLLLAAICLVLGGAVLRFNAFIVGFNPPAGYVYFPSVIELLTSIGLLALEIVGFIYIVKRFPILPPRKKSLPPGKVQVV
jgi:Ni/Fe-hydrogenase subunit HybB-like protein